MLKMTKEAQLGILLATMILFRRESNHLVTAALAVLFLCICSSRIDPCWGENDYETTMNIHSIPSPSIRANRFPSVETRIKLYMSNWYVPPCPGDDGAFVKYSFDNKDEDTTNSESESLISWRCCLRKRQGVALCLEQAPSSALITRRASSSHEAE